MPLEFSPHERWLLSTRIMVQAPQGMTTEQIRSTQAFVGRAVKGLPPDVFMMLDALRLLADQGNDIAKALFDRECAALGLTRPFASYAK